MAKVFLKAYEKKNKQLSVQEMGGLK